MLTGAGLISIERQRQQDEEGFDAHHDDEHTRGELALAGALYATPILLYERIDDYVDQVIFRDPWPWDRRWDKRAHHGNVLVPPSLFYVNRQERIRQLVKAGALIAAEIDRIERQPDASPKGRRHAPASPDRL